MADHDFDIHVTVKEALPAGSMYPFYSLLVICMSLVFGCTHDQTHDGNGGDDINSRSSLGSETASLLLESEAAYKRGDYQLALVLVDSAQNVTPNVPHASFLKARIYTRIGQFDRAASAYRNVSEVDSTYTGLWYNWGNVLYRQGNYERALQLYRKEEDEELRSRVLTNMGRAYSDLGKIDSARTAFHEAVNADSTNTTALGWLSHFYSDEGRVHRALTYSRKMMDLAPTDPDYRYMLGSQLVQAGAYQEAVPHLELVLESRPSHNGAHYNLGRALLRLDQAERANAHLAKSDSLEKIQSRIENQRRYAQSNPQEASAWIALGRSLQNLNHLEQALQAYQSARVLRPSDPDLLTAMADIYLAKEDTTRALNHYRKALNIDSTIPDALFGLGVVHANRGNVARARKAMKSTLHYRPDDRRARKYLRAIGGQ